MWIGLGIVLVVLLLAVAGFAVLRGLRNTLYPTAPPMPPVVSGSMDELLTKLENVLKLKAPNYSNRCNRGFPPKKLASWNIAPECNCLTN